MKGGLFMRKGGILMHISSLPSEYGIGKLGKYAYGFVDFLVGSGIKLWQVLPLSSQVIGILHINHFLLCWKSILY